MCRKLQSRRKKFQLYHPTPQTPVALTPHRHLSAGKRKPPYPQPYGTIL
ncbi:hypothetical protein [Microcoleus sp. FACHB-68]|nr:hypothetical protein [Microcoleus sp. FACHB-68]